MSHATLSELATPTAEIRRSAFAEPHFMRVRDVDDGSVDGLVRLLRSLRRIKGAVTAGAVLATGAAIASWLPSEYLFSRFGAALLVGMTIINGTCAWAVGSLTVRRLFVVEARRYGLSRSASWLLLTRAERRARFLRPFAADDVVAGELLDAVRDPDRA